VKMVSTAWKLRVIKWHQDQYQPYDKIWGKKDWYENEIFLELLHSNTASNLLVN
jgi:hypothetical protein